MGVNLISSVRLTLPSYGVLWKCKCSRVRSLLGSDARQGLTIDPVYIPCKMNCTYLHLIACRLIILFLHRHMFPTGYGRHVVNPSWITIDEASDCRQQYIHPIHGSMPNCRRYVLLFPRIMLYIYRGDRRRTHLRGARIRIQKPWSRTTCSVRHQLQISSRSIIRSTQRTVERSRIDACKGFFAGWLRRCLDPIANILKC